MQFHYVETEGTSVDKKFNTVCNKFFGGEVEGSLRGGGEEEEGGGGGGDLRNQARWSRPFQHSEARCKYFIASLMGGEGQANLKLFKVHLTEPFYA